jgi:hypothetical protein
MLKSDMLNITKVIFSHSLLFHYHLDQRQGNSIMFSLPVRCCNVHVMLQHIDKSYQMADDLTRKNPLC